MKYASPEAVGISSADVLNFYKNLDEYHLSTHAVIMARGDRVFTECYYAPFHKNFLHRMYSVSKSFVSIAIGFCEQDGLISLDDPIEKYFEEYLADKPEKYRQNTTIRELLKMESAVEREKSWFSSGCSDRVAAYFDNIPDKNSNTLFRYDSSGSFLLGVIVEKVTGKPFLKYLQERVLDDIGFSKDAYTIQAPGGHSLVTRV